MAASFWDRVTNRRALAEKAIRGFLAHKATRHAVNKALRQLQSEASTVRRHRPHDAEYLDAELAAEILDMAFNLHTRKPVRPEGCEDVAAPEDLLLTFAAVQARERDKHQIRHTRRHAA
jgi:hypothetical protein